MLKKLTISEVTSAEESRALDNLLWQVLWEPLSFPRNIREKFTMKGKPLEFTAKHESKLIGGLVAYRTAPAEVEIRHLAVLPEFQGKGAGGALVRHLLSYASENGCNRVYTIARNTSVDFFKKLGFTVNLQQKPPDHPAFTKHCITFSLLELFL
jgi:N-acetylglutamate synthase-like GNAT family acetyltransferase